MNLLLLLLLSLILTMVGLGLSVQSPKSHVTYLHLIYKECNTHLEELWNEALCGKPQKMPTLVLNLSKDTTPFCYKMLFHLLG